MFNIRDFDSQKDTKAAHRIWREIGWLEDDEQEQSLEVFLTEGRALVAELDHNAECLVTSKSATMRYLKQALDIAVVTSVGTGRIARKQGLAKKLTARIIAADAEAGALASTLGIFEQGFYDQLGYGTGSYEHWITFDPADLKVNQTIRPPKRLGKADWQMIHRARLDRQPHHGMISLLPTCVTRAELAWSKGGYGLGYTDGPAGELTHFFWATDKGEFGPTTIHAMAYQNQEQFVELVALIRNLGDQVRLVKMREPAGIQLQDMINNPFRGRITTEKSKFEHINRASAYWQTRICDLEACLKATHLNSRTIQFNLELSDPIVQYLDSASTWQGCAGEFCITLGPDSKANEGFQEGLPLLKADIGAFTRLWLGVRPATGLSVTDALDGPADLLEDLDEILCIPEPHPDWDY